MVGRLHGYSAKNRGGLHRHLLCKGWEEEILGWRREIIDLIQVPFICGSVSQFGFSGLRFYRTDIDWRRTISACSGVPTFLPKCLVGLWLRGKVMPISKVDVG